MRRIITSALCMFFILGCAGAQLEKDMKEKNGYSEADITEIRAKGETYKSRLANGQVGSNIFDHSARDQQMADVKAIFCKCQKQLGPKCSKGSAGLTPEEHDVWLKGNAANWAVAAMQMNVGDEHSLDPDTCP